jgi:radical SAM-linked protein
MVFAAPLSIGTESVVEFLDIRLSERADPEKLRCALNANMTDELVAVEAYYPESKFTDLKWMSYRITIRTLGQIDELVDSCNALLSAPVIEVQKKNSEKMADIRPLIKSASAVKDGDAIVINALLSADPSAFLNPEYVIKALRDGVGVLSSDDLTAESYEIMRLNAYFADMSEFR